MIRNKQALYLSVILDVMFHAMLAFRPSNLFCVGVTYKVLQINQTLCAVDLNCKVTEGLCRKKLEANTKKALLLLEFPSRVENNCLYH